MLLKNNEETFPDSHQFDKEDEEAENIKGILFPLQLAAMEDNFDPNDLAGYHEWHAQQ